MGDGGLNLEELVHCTYKNLFDLKLDPSLLFNGKLEGIKQEIPARVMDDSTFELIEIPLLFKKINHTKTITGALTLYRSLIQPLSELDLIHAKQESVLELNENKMLRRSLNEWLNYLAKKEEEVYDYFVGRVDTPYHGISEFSFYRTYHRTTEFFRRLMEGVKEIPTPSTPYLELLVEDIKSTEYTYGMELIRGPVYRTLTGFKPKEKISFFTPRIRFTLCDVKPSIMIPLVLTLPIAVLTGNANHLFEITFITIIGGGLSSFYSKSFDYHTFALPLKDIYSEEPNIRKAIEALGKIDELMSFCNYLEAMRGTAVMPVVTDGSPHYFIAKQARNPILADGSSDCVANDIELSGQKITFITGPNSGGKTTYCKTIAQLQIMAMIGSPIPADSAEMSTVDRIFYQQQKIDTLGHGLGRLGTELEVVRDDFFQSTQRSLNIMDAVLAGATTQEEGFEQMYQIMNGFYRKGGNTILITPDYQLAEGFKQEGKGQFLQVELKDQEPTYKLIPDISRWSHPERVAEELGFSQRDMDDHLTKKDL